MSAPPPASLTLSHSHNLARLIGPTLLTISLAETLNPHIWATSTASAVFLNGAVVFTASLATVQAHSLWRWTARTQTQTQTPRWAILVTLAGWAGVVVGLTRMLAPERVLEGVRRAGAGQVKVAAGVVAAFGAILTVCGYCF
ncbi:hypothetical protein AYO21_06238 [Fonsecaea monophora]|uniref:Uncharacterized protein n=1 Tax=Fonsecaea monophora TaxID=254056 RepID=A0A177F5T6_9EURO|nr:hypothetical protein AYO21_06238 [Fonsecaea monophora]OAG39594.1 hypothetical protein AYO21_06238 [Fonsecaea monophora]